MNYQQSLFLSTLRRMKKDKLDIVDSTTEQQITTIKTRVSDAHPYGTPLHFFVRRISGGNTIVIHTNLHNSVGSVHQQIEKITGVPITEQRLIYRGKQLQWEQLLGECGVQNDADLQLAGRMRSTEYPRSWRVVNDLVSSVWLCRKETQSQVLRRVISLKVKEFFDMIPRDDDYLSVGHLQVFTSSGAPGALVMLYFSPMDGNRECAESSIRLFLRPHINSLPKTIQNQCVPIILEFCKLLGKTDSNGDVERLFLSCRSTLATLFESIGKDGGEFFFHEKASVVIKEIYPFVFDLSSRLCISLKNILDSPIAKFLGDFHDFSAYLIPLCGAIVDEVGGVCRIPICVSDTQPYWVPEIGSLYTIFLDMLKLVDEGLKNLEEVLAGKDGSNEIEIDSSQLVYTHYLTVLKELKNISKLYQGAEEKLSHIMSLRRFSVNALIRNSRDDNSWLLLYMDITDFESRRHLVMMMLPDVKNEYDELFEMLIDRSNLLSDSFGYIARADPDSLKDGLFVEFKNEEATGRDVLREWFYLVSQAIFNPQIPLFLACPNDPRRFFPNPASYMKPVHLRYFQFCGRILALSLMHDMQLGVTFDRVFFLQLAGSSVTLEDVCDADPCLYMTCKNILEMDAECLDSDGLGLTFVREVEEVGLKRVVELCPGGKGIVLNSRNRQDYVNLLIHHCFVASISQQVSNFSQGFADVLRDSSRQKLFFQGLDLEDLDLMLNGSYKASCIKD